MSAFVLLAHGSPDPRSADAVRHVAHVVSRRVGAPVVAAFLDHDSPALGSAVAAIAHDDSPSRALDAGRVSRERHVMVLPLLLSAAFHARVDVPAAVAALGSPVTLLPPLGHPPRVLDRLLVRAGGPAVVVAAGTRVGSERDAFLAAVDAASRRTGVAACGAFASGPGPAVDDVLVDESVVIPWLLAPGRFLDLVRASASAHRVLGDGLLAEPLLLDEITELLAGARAAASR